MAGGALSCPDHDGLFTAPDVGSLCWPPATRFLEASKPAGGFAFMSVAQLLLPWQAYRQGLIDPLALCAYLATREMLERRCQKDSGTPARYGPDELRILLGLPPAGRARAVDALRRLQAMGLLSWSQGELHFIQHPNELHKLDQARYDALRACIHPELRRVPVPRRLLRYLAREGSPGLIGTILGVLLRCLRYTRHSCRAGGAVSAAWIAACFGLSERTAYRGLRELEALGWLATVCTPPWHRRQYGPWRVVNLAWDRPPAGAPARPVPPAGKPVQLELFLLGAEDGDAATEAAGDLHDAAPTCMPAESHSAPAINGAPAAIALPFAKFDAATAQTTEISPHADLPLPPVVDQGVDSHGDREDVCQHLAVLDAVSPQHLAVLALVTPRNFEDSPFPMKNLIQESKHPELVATEPTGVCIMRAAVLAFPQHGQEASSSDNQGRQYHHAKPGSPSVALPPPSLAHVTPGDLCDLDRVLALRDQAIARDWLTGCEADRLNVIAAAVHALRCADRNPGGLFVAMLRAQRWELITQADEDHARAWVREHDYGPRCRTAPDLSALAPPLELSRDARVIVLTQRVLAQADWRGDPFLAVKLYDPTWTRRRWEQAQAELERWHLQQAQARAHTRMATLPAVFEAERPWDRVDDAW